MFFTVLSYNRTALPCKSIFCYAGIIVMQTTHIRSRFSLFFLHLCALVVSCIALTSCGSSLPVGDVQQWNIELAEPIANKCTGESMVSISSDMQPQYIAPTATREARLRVFSMTQCENDRDRVYDIPASRVKRVTYVSDPLQPPKVYALEDNPPPPDPCCRHREGAWGFDKIELRVMAGIRGRDDETYLHQTAEGKVPYESSFFNLERGGSNLLVGAETAWLWSLDEKGAFQLGPMLGVWPTDGSVFIPLGIHPRYTFTPNPDHSEFEPNCNTWFVYGDVGLPFDFQSGAPVFGDSFNRQRLFYGLGIGHDWAWGCDKDFSVDIGVRRMHLPLPEIECCPDVPSDQRNAYRASTSVYVRLGITL